MAKTRVAGPSNTSTAKKFGVKQFEEPADITNGPMYAHVSGKPGKYEGQLKSRPSEDFANPLTKNAGAEIRGLAGLHNDIGESSGFITDGYLDTQGTAYGEAAKFNFLPPGMDISNQENAEINTMPLRKVIAESYPGDGWMPAPRDLPE